MTRYSVTVTVEVPEGDDRGCDAVRSEFQSWLEDLGWNPQVSVLLADAKDHEADCECEDCDSNPDNFGACGDCPECGSLSPWRCGCDVETPETVSCPMCGGPGGLLGELGDVAHYRCRDCGADFSRRA